MSAPPTAGGSRGPLFGDFQPSEVGAAVLVALCVLAGAALALRVSALDRPSEGAEIDKGTAIPVRVTPVLDLDAPLLKLGGKHDRMKLPDRWVRQKQVQRVEEKAFVSTKAGKTEQDIPRPDMKIADAGTAPPPPDAAMAKEVDTPLTAPVDAGPPANVATLGSPDGVKEGTETDPLKARAVDLYRARIIGWFAGRFRVTGSGLSAADLARYKVGATVELSPDRQVSGYSITPSGNAAFDAAARAALESAKGNQNPSPAGELPERRPILHPPHVRLQRETMRLNPVDPARPPVRARAPGLALAGTALLTLAVTSLTFAQAPPPADRAPNPDDLLGNLVVVAGGGRSLPKIGVLPSLAAAMEDVTVRSVVRRDLDLCGEFEVLPDSAAPEGLYLSDSPIDVKAWSAKGVEAVVKVTGKKGANNQAEIHAQAYFTNRGQAPVYDRRFLVPEAELRVEAHHLADLVIGALTGLNGGFASHLAFSSASGPIRRVFTIDADGNDARAVSPESLAAIAPAFGKNEELFYAAGPPDDLYQVYEGSGTLVPLAVKGAVYGIAFSKDRSAVAVSLGVGATISVFRGADFAHLTQASPIGMALHPTFTPSGKLAFMGEGKWSERVYVDGKPISPDGLFASSPTFCDNPNGVRAVFAVGVGKDTDLVSTGESGGGLARLTQGQGRNGYPACSPDGRLVAFFSTRTSGEGPGLYVMRLDGGRPKRVSTLLGDSLRWDPLAPSKAVELKN